MMFAARLEAAEDGGLQRAGLAGELLLDHVVELVQRRGLNAVERRDAHDRRRRAAIRETARALRPPGPASRYASTMAMICGCSWRISSATARASIHFSASRPLLERPNRMRSMTPRGLVFAERADQHLAQVFVDADAERGLAFHGRGEVARAPGVTSSREMFCSCVMAAPMRCTSLAPMCFITSAASCSPSDSSRMAARSVPLRLASWDCFLLIVADPRLHDLCDARRILRDQRARLRNLSVVVERVPAACRTRHAARRSGSAAGTYATRGAASNPRTSGRSTMKTSTSSTIRPASSFAMSRTSGTLPQRNLVRAARLPVPARPGTKR